MDCLCMTGSTTSRRAIDSVLARTYLALEVADNASSDRNEEICRRYAEADARLRHKVATSMATIPPDG